MTIHFDLYSEVAIKRSNVSVAKIIIFFIVLIVQINYMIGVALNNLK